jgi:hypothetical protein
MSVASPLDRSAAGRRAPRAGAARATPAALAATPDPSAGAASPVALTPVGPGARLLLVLLMVTLLLPIHPVLAGVRLDPYRLLLLLATVPFTVALIAGRAGRFTLSDGLMIAFAVWMFATFVIHHGMERVPYAVISATEMLGGYMAGRLLIRSTGDYRRFIGLYLGALLVLLPFAVIELYTFRMPIADAFRGIFPVTTKNLSINNQRYGLSRVQAVFPHAILFGLFCSLILANVYYLYRDRLVRLLPRLGLVVAMSLMSLSSAPFLAVGLQGLMILWDRVTRGRWKLLIGLSTFVFVALEILSNRGPVILMIEYLTLSPQTAWWRVHIWNFGSASVLAHPLFGIGLNDWVRPEWLASTVDNFWLLVAMRHGLPCIGFLVAALLLHVFHIVRRRGLTPEQAALRTGYMVGLVGLCFTLATVHVWNAVAVIVMLYIGAGAFLYTPAPARDAAADPESAPPAAAAAPRSPSGPARGPSPASVPTRAGAPASAAAPPDPLRAGAGGRHLPYSRFPSRDRHRPEPFDG